MKRLLLPGLVASVLFAASGCASGEPQPMRLACETDAECIAENGEGWVCFEDGCGSEVDVAVVVTPNTTGLVTQDFNTVDVSGSRMELSLKEAALIEGTLRIDDNGVRSVYGSKFTISAKGSSSNVPGVEFAPVKQVFDKGDGRFSLAVSPGVWELTATAENKSIPPAFTQKSAASGVSLDPELLLAGRGGSTEFRGEVVRTADDRDLGDPNAAFRFQVLDPLRNVALSQALEFAGSPLTYALTALRSPGALVLRVTPVGDALLPSKDFRSDDGKPESLGLLELGDFGKPIDVIGRALDPNGNPIANAVVHFEGKVRGGGSFTVDTKTNDKDRSGTFSIRVLPNDEKGGNYRVTIRPPPESPWASASIDAAVLYDPNATGPLTLPAITCPQKTQLKGSVNDVAGKPLGDVVVQIEPNSASLNPGTTRIETITDKSGRYEALVEPGAYRVVVKPGFSRKLPWSSRRVVVSGPTSVVPTIILSDARIVEGTVFGPRSAGGRALPNANVTVYRVAQGVERGEPPVSIKLYDAVTDSQGNFQVILPKSASSEEAQ